MHNLVKEATGIDFNQFGDDLTAAKELVLKTNDICHDNQQKSYIEASQSVGHLLNEVNLSELENLIFINLQVYNGPVSFVTKKKNVPLYFVFHFEV